MLKLVCYEFVTVGIILRGSGEEIDHRMDALVVLFAEPAAADDILSPALGVNGNLNVSSARRIATAMNADGHHPE
jgi:hypothetical protein